MSLKQCKQCKQCRHFSALAQKEPMDTPRKALVQREAGREGLTISQLVILVRRLARCAKHDTDDESLAEELDIFASHAYQSPLSLCVVSAQPQLWTVMFFCAKSGEAADTLHNVLLEDAKAQGVRCVKVLSAWSAITKYLLWGYQFPGTDERKRQLLRLFISSGAQDKQKVTDTFRSIQLCETGCDAVHMELSVQEAEEDVQERTQRVDDAVSREKPDAGVLAQLSQLDLAPRLEQGQDVCVKNLQVQAQTRTPASCMYQLYDDAKQRIKRTKRDKEAAAFVLGMNRLRKAFSIRYLDLPFAAHNQGKTNLCTLSSLSSLLRVQEPPLFCPDIYSLYAHARRRHKSDAGYTLDFVFFVFRYLIPPESELELELIDLTFSDAQFKRFACRTLLEQQMPFVSNFRGHAQLFLELNAAGEVLSLNSHGPHRFLAGYSVATLAGLQGAVQELLFVKRKDWDFPKLPGDKCTRFIKSSEEKRRVVGLDSLCVPRRGNQPVGAVARSRRNTSRVYRGFAGANCLSQDRSLAEPRLGGRYSDPGRNRDQDLQRSPCVQRRRGETSVC